jgi:hypothetical protein
VFFWEWLVQIAVEDIRGKIRMIPKLGRGRNFQDAGRELESRWRSEHRLESARNPLLLPIKDWEKGIETQISGVLPSGLQEQRLPPHAGGSGQDGERRKKRKGCHN